MIILVGGGKGGVGKSLVSMGALDFHISQGQKPVLIDTDTANPDVYKAYQGKDCEAYALDIDTDKGWMGALDKIGEALEADKPLVINTGARNSKAILNYGATLNEIPTLLTLWVINDQRDSLQLLKDYMQTVKKPVCVVKNGVFAKEDEFDIFDKSKMKSNGMPSVYFPKAMDMITDKLYNERKAIHELMQTLSFGGKLMAKQWINDVHSVYEKIVGYTTKS